MSFGSLGQLGGTILGNLTPLGPLGGFIGGAVGGALGGLLDPKPQGQNSQQTGPRLQDLTVQTASSGTITSLTNSPDFVDA